MPEAEMQMHLTLVRASTHALCTPIRAQKDTPLIMKDFSLNPYILYGGAKLTQELFGL